MNTVCTKQENSINCWSWHCQKIMQRHMFVCCNWCNYVSGEKCSWFPMYSWNVLSLLSSHPRCLVYTFVADMQRPCQLAVHQSKLGRVNATLILLILQEWMLRNKSNMGPRTSQGHPPTRSQFVINGGIFLDNLGDFTPKKKWPLTIVIVRNHDLQTGNPNFLLKVRGAFRWKPNSSCGLLRTTMAGLKTWGWGRDVGPQEPTSPKGKV